MAGSDAAGHHEVVFKLTPIGQYTILHGFRRPRRGTTSGVPGVRLRGQSLWDHAPRLRVRRRGDIQAGCGG